MKKRTCGFILCAIIFGIFFGWKGLLGTILLFLCLWFADLSQPAKPPIKKDNQSDTKKDDTAIYGAICGDN